MVWKVVGETLTGLTEEGLGTDRKYCTIEEELWIGPFNPSYTYIRHRPVKMNRKS